MPEPVRDKIFAPEVTIATDSIGSPSSCAPSHVDPAIETWSALGLLGRLLRQHLFFVDICANLFSPTASIRRERELFPLPIIPRDYLSILPEISDVTIGDACDYFLGVVAALNWLYGYRGFDFTTGKITTAQSCAHKVIVTAGLELHGRLRGDVESRSRRGWRFFEDKGAEPRLELVASAVAVPDCAATCDPAELIGGKLGRSIQDASVMFADAPTGLDRFPGFYSGPRSEYIELTARQLKARLLRLSSYCRGGASVFPVGKAEGKQRVVWNGTRISAAAARPPPPVHLADPAVFGMLDVAAGRQLRVTKRDCRTWFDQLAVNYDVALYFARPAITRRELLAAGFSCDDIIDFGGDGASDSFFPYSCVWPMGFSWSSCVAQSTLLSICTKAGLVDSMVLAADAVLPQSLDLCFAVATDDLMIFSDAGPGHTSTAALAVEESMMAHGIIKNPDKDINDVLTATCFGVGLIDGRFWCPPAPRIWSLLDAVRDLAVQRAASPGAVAGYLGRPVVQSPATVEALRV